MKTIVKLLFYPLILLLHFSCDSVEPDGNGNGVDTTSHNFTFQTWTFGEHSSSALYDVAIVNDSLIWAVGELYLNDSLGNPDPTPYNAIVWNGLDWEIIRIPTKTFSGVIVSSRIITILSFGKNDVWTFSITGAYSHWNGNNWTTEFVNERDGRGNKLWGTSSADIYLACNNGGISHYNGNNWQRINSSTELDIYDIFGNVTTSGSYEILCVAGDISSNDEKRILRIDNNSVIQLSTNGIPSTISGIWFKHGERYYVVGSGIYIKNDISSNNGWESISSGITEYFTNSIDGNDVNDIVVCGVYSELLHFNGFSWRSFKNEIQAGSYSEVKIRNNLVVAVGSDLSTAIITFGDRN